jgi:hypothetical protein
VDGVVREWIQGKCAYDDEKGQKGTACGSDLESTESTWIVKARATGCATYLDRSNVRLQVFSRLFDQDRPLAKGRDQSCADAYPSPGQKRVRTSCDKARIALNLSDQLQKLRCAGLLEDSQTRATVRELNYVIGERLVYRVAFEDLRGPKGNENLDAFIDAFARVDLSTLGREELAYGVRFLGVYAYALDVAPAPTASWITLLVTDLSDLNGDPAAAYQRLLHGAALGSNRKPPEASVRDVRDAAKDFLTLPVLALRQQQQEADAASKARAAIARLIKALAVNPGGAGSYPEYVAALSTFLGEIADVFDTQSRVDLQRASAVATPPRDEEQANRPALFARAATALQQTALALELASKRDWVGLAIRVSDELTRYGSAAEPAEFARSLRFIRVLLSMYQAASVEEAKAIFAANLEDVASRERRYSEPQVAIDVTALLGVSFGGLHTSESGPPSKTDDSLLVGLYAPFGVQISKGWWGALVYPLDLGSYLVATPNTQSASATWTTAIRFGAAGYFRPWAETPVVFGAGTDYKPEFQSRTEWRYFVTASLELPLFLLH